MPITDCVVGNTERVLTLTATANGATDGTDTVEATLNIQVDAAPVGLVTLLDSHFSGTDTNSVINPTNVSSFKTIANWMLSCWGLVPSMNSRSIFSDVGTNGPPSGARVSGALIQR